MSDKAKEFYNKWMINKLGLTDKGTSYRGVLSETTQSLLMQAYAEAYHKEKVNEVTDEMIDRIFQLDKNIHQAHQLKVLYKRKGAKWLKEQLLKQ